MGAGRGNSKRASAAAQPHSPLSREEARGRSRLRSQGTPDGVVHEVKTPTTENENSWFPGRMAINYDSAVENDGSLGWLDINDPYDNEWDHDLMVPKDVFQEALKKVVNGRDHFSRLPERFGETEALVRANDEGENETLILFVRGWSRYEENQLERQDYAWNGVQSDTPFELIAAWRLGDAQDLSDLLKKMDENEEEFARLLDFNPLRIPNGLKRREF